MDSKERDERIKKGFGERGEKIFNTKKKRKRIKESLKEEPAPKAEEINSNRNK